MDKARQAAIAAAALRERKPPLKVEAALRAAGVGYDDEPTPPPARPAPAGPRFGKQFTEEELKAQAAQKARLLRAKGLL